MRATSLKTIFGVTILGLALGACTKEIKYQYQYKEEVLAKNLVDTQSDYIYLASMQNASRSSSDALPFSSGDSKRVRLEWTKDSLKVMEKEKDARYSGNSANDKLVLEIPVDHVDYRCAKDKYGQCTNNEEEIRDAEWNQKTKFKMKVGSARSGELDILPIMISQTLGENCYQEVSSKVQNYEITDQAINFRIERTYKTRLECLSNDATLSDATISAIFHYSLVKVDSILTPGFKTMEYPLEDETTFGFFATKKDVLDVDNNKIETGTKTIINRWNPNRDEIVYSLSSEFYKPENQSIKEMTLQTVNNINQGLAEAGVKFRLRIDDVTNRVPGDIRNTMIVLVEDPVASNIIGYGPRTEDPATGEIISAQTIMFLGTIKKFIKYTYEEIIREKAKTAGVTAVVPQKGKQEASVSVFSPAAIKGMVLDPVVIKNSQKFLDLESHSHVLDISHKHSLNNKLKGHEKELSLGKLEKIKKDIKSYTKHINPEYVDMKTDKVAQLRYQHEAKNCGYAPAAEVVAGGLSKKLMDKFPADAKPWENLTDAEKQTVVDIILPEIWIPTLIHEMGHNLGLRHNFQASEDKANFFTDAELKAKGLDHNIPFSSVMDYGNDLKTLNVLGKYDIAALKFGYLRQVETKDGKVVELNSSTLKDMKTKKAAPELKAYGYCTDDNVGANAGCKRFDEGTTYTEIAQNLIKSYEEAYYTRNFRRNKASMSLIDDLQYGARIKSTFMEMRTFLEVVERVKYRFQLPDDSKYWKEVEYLKDLRDAAILSGQFLAKVVLTPDVTCALSKKDAPDQIAVERLDNIDPQAMSCFDVELKSFDVIGQAGKALNSKKDPKSSNPYADQIDLRGIWADKLIAVRMLFDREVGSYTFDKNIDNFYDLPELTETLSKVVESVLMNKNISPVDFVQKDGKIKKIKMKVDTLGGNYIKKTIHPIFSKRFGVPHRDFYINEILSQTVATQMVKGFENESFGLDFSNAVKVKRVPIMSDTTNLNPIKAVTTVMTEIENDRFYANVDNKLAQTVIDQLEKVRKLMKVDQQVLIQIALAMANGKVEVPAEASPAEKEVWGMSPEIIGAYLTGQLSSPDELILILKLLAQ